MKYRLSKPLPFAEVGTEVIVSWDGIGVYIKAWAYKVDKSVEIWLGDTKTLIKEGWIESSEDMKAEELFEKYSEMIMEENESAEYNDAVIKSYILRRDGFNKALSEYEQEIRMEQDLINQKAWLDKQDRIFAEYKVEIHKLIDEMIESKNNMLNYFRRYGCGSDHK